MRITVQTLDWTRKETEEFVGRMQPSETRELLGETGLSPTALAAAIEDDVRETRECGGLVFGARIDGTPCAVFAAAPDSPLADSAKIWLISSRECEAHKTAFGRWSLRCFREICRRLPDAGTFWNWTQETNSPADTRQWLAWLGARFSDTEKWRSPWTGETFSKFFIPRYERSP